MRNLAWLLLLVVFIPLMSCGKNYINRPEVPAPCDSVEVEDPKDDDDDD